MFWRKDSLYVGQQGDGSTFNCLVNRAGTETECVLNIHIVKLRNACKLYWFSSILKRCLDEEQTFNISAVIIWAYTGHAGISFEDRNTCH